MKVLIADDSGLILDRLQEMLSMYKQAELIGSYKDGKSPCCFKVFETGPCDS